MVETGIRADRVTADGELLEQWWFYLGLFFTFKYHQFSPCVFAFPGKNYSLPFSLEDGFLVPSEY